MRCSHLVMLIVVLPVLLSSLEIQLAQGIKCYSCGPCPGKGEERKCGAEHDACSEITRMRDSNPISISRSCSSKAIEGRVKEKGEVDCDKLRPIETVRNSTLYGKHCFCYEDLCNELIPPPTPTTPGSSASVITGFSTFLQILGASISAFLIKGTFKQ
ncbi:hypothetical protein Ocin01_19786 [Orchesella cincta]|uniref:Protein sleepless n=1 Tax=Orchesella cincta TaxID=48709 RepID=A0A1D2M1Q5_ORCCI|nr:hypothetical protein Ocin01_19786 [Orchesella cincta]